MIELLGRRTGEFHLRLAEEREKKEFTPEPFSKLYQRAVYQSLRTLLKRVISAVSKKSKRADGDERELLDRVLAMEPSILEAFSSITAYPIRAQKIRIHGDYHLGQVLFTGKDFVIIDLEGEPARPIGERRLKYSAFRDVAGMIRSFHYAVSQQFLSYTEQRPEDHDVLAQWIDVWYGYVAGTFLSSYLETVDGAACIPADADARVRLISIFLLEKAVYEVAYELNNRPDWLSIPVRGLEHVLSSNVTE
jgi:maltose alpha-D-glucosyltransferase/alpha-amylase